MNINGKEVKLFYCLGAAKDLTELSGNITNLGEFLSGEIGTAMDHIAKVIFVMNHWYCKAAACNGEQADSISYEELDMFLDPNQAEDYLAEIQEALNKGTKKTVEVKPVQTKNAKSGRSR